MSKDVEGWVPNVKPTASIPGHEPTSNGKIALFLAGTALLIAFAAVSADREGDPTQEASLEPVEGAATPSTPEA